MPYIFAQDYVRARHASLRTVINDISQYFGKVADDIFLLLKPDITLRVFPYKKSGC